MKTECIQGFDSKIRKCPIFTKNSYGSITTFINTFSYYKLIDSKCRLNQIDFVHIDGFLQVFLHNVFSRERVNRVSFDFSSIADDIFSYSLKRGYRMALVGATEKEIDSAVLNLKNKYNNIDIGFWRNGYFRNDAEKYDLYTSLKEKDIQVLIIGMGTPYQEELAVFLKEAGLKSYIFTCGGFITQTAIRIDYYNRFKKGRFRWLQRLIEFKHVRKRLFFNYPIKDKAVKP
jgi:N-acetylglucosaminyldiphosphoundecaprenol N-acetyl-beta-D-mannosaminyltransferase